MLGKSTPTKAIHKTALLFKGRKNKQVWWSEGSYYKEPHGLAAVARGYLGTAPLPPDAKDICCRVLAFRKSPAHSQLEPAKHSARRLPRASCCWHSKRRCTVPNILFSKQLLHAKQRGLKHQRSCVLATYRKTVPFPRALQFFLCHRARPIPCMLWECLHFS